MNNSNLFSGITLSEAIWLHPNIYRGCICKGRECGGDQDRVYRKASWVKGWAVSLHNWTGYFYTMLMSWAACWHVYPYILSNILSNSLSLSLHATSVSPPRTPFTLHPPPTATTIHPHSLPFLFTLSVFPPVHPRLLFVPPQHLPVSSYSNKV